MAAIKGKNTKPEMIVRKYLFSRGSTFPCSGQETAGNPGYCSAEIQDCHLRQWLFLAWS